MPVVVLTAILGVVVLAILAIFVEEVHFVIQHYTHKELKLKIMAMLGLYPVCIATDYTYVVLAKKGFQISSKDQRLID